MNEVRVLANPRAASRAARRVHAAVGRILAGACRGCLRYEMKSSGSTAAALR